MAFLPFNLFGQETLRSGEWRRSGWPRLQRRGLRGEALAQARLPRLERRLGRQGGERGLAHRVEIVAAHEEKAAADPLVEQPERRARHVGRPLLLVHEAAGPQEALVEAGAVERGPAEDRIESFRRALRDAIHTREGPANP